MQTMESGESIQLLNRLSNPVCHCANTGPLTLPPLQHQSSTCWQCSSVALLFRALHQLYLVFVILGQGKIKSGWKLGRIALEVGPSCSTGAAGAVQPGY